MQTLKFPCTFPAADENHSGISFDSLDLPALTALVKERCALFPELRAIVIESYPGNSFFNPPVEQLRELPQTCQDEGIEFQFSRMKELEDHWAAESRSALET